MKKMVLVKDYGKCTALLLETEKADSCIEDAVELAEKEGLCCLLSTIPDRIWEKAGAKLLEAEVIERQERWINPSLQRARCATCRDCFSFTDGVCCKYGGICDPDQTAMDCVHGEEVLELLYDGEHREYIILTEWIGAVKAAEIMAEGLKESIREYAGKGYYSNDLWELKEKE